MRRALLLILFVILARVVAVEALVVVPVDLERLSEMSKVIVLGTVTAVQPQPSLDRRRVETLVSLDAASYLKGGLGRELTFRVPGGEFGRYRTVIPGAPVFAPGDEVVLFLGIDGPSFPYIIGLSQGVFRIRIDSGAGERRVLALPSSPDGDTPSVIVRGDAARGPLPVDQFLAAIRAAVGGTR
jgi:hypothetical protein